MDPHLDATGQAHLVRSGEASPRELVEAAVERVEALDGELNAVIHPLFEKALETEPADGPFQGVPMVVKDLVCTTAGDPHHEGMRFLRDLDWRADGDSWLARRFREAGFVFVGRTSTPELGILPTTEPRPAGRAATPGTRRVPPAAPAGVRPRQWRRAWCRSRTRATAAARSAFLPRPAAWLG
jgi:amidase